MGVGVPTGQLGGVWRKLVLQGEWHRTPSQVQGDFGGLPGAPAGLRPCGWAGTSGGLESGCHIPCSCPTPGPGVPLCPPVPAVCPGPGRCQHWNVPAAASPPALGSHAWRRTRVLRMCHCPSAFCPWCPPSLPALPPNHIPGTASAPFLPSLCSTVLIDGSCQGRALRIPGSQWGFGEYGTTPCRSEELRNT